MSFRIFRFSVCEHRFHLSCCVHPTKFSETLTVIYNLFKIVCELKGTLTLNSGVVARFGILAIIGASLILSSLAASADQVAGTVDFRYRIPINALSKGTVAAVNVNVADSVETGTVLIEFNPTRQAAKVRARQSQVDRIQIALDSASAKFERQQELFDRGSLSLLAYEESEIEVRTVRAQLVEAQAKLDAAKIRLQDTRLISPIDAIVLEKNVHPGMNVLPNESIQPLMVLGSAQEYVVRVTVPFEQRVLIEAGNRFQVMLHILNYLPDVNFVARYLAEVEFSTLDPITAKNGMQYPVNLHFREESALILPGTPATVIFE